MFVIRVRAAWRVFCYLVAIGHWLTAWSAAWAVLFG